MVKNLPAMQETRVLSLSWEDSLQKGMATHSSILAWRIPWTEESGGIQSMGSQRVGRDWLSLSCFTDDPFIYINAVPWAKRIMPGSQLILNKYFLNEYKGCHPIFSFHSTSPPFLPPPCHSQTHTHTHTHTQIHMHIHSTLPTISDVHIIFSTINFKLIC